MATSGTRVYNPQFAEILEESFERIQIQPIAITQDHITSAIRSANLMQIDWGNAQTQQHRIIQQDITLAATDRQYDLPAGTLDVWSAILVKAGETQDRPVWPIGRLDYQRIPNKLNPGDPHSYFVDKSQLNNGLRQLFLWPVPDEVATLRIWAMVRPEDVTALPETLSTSWEWYPAYVAELTARLAEKWRPDLESDKRQKADDAWRLANRADSERAPARFRARGYGMR